MHRAVVACSALKEEISTVLPEGLETMFLEYALHRQPEKLNGELRRAINRETSGCQEVILGYGLCSNGTLGLGHSCKRLIIPRVHDCISILLGSAERYFQEFNKEPGTIYLSKGWIDSCGDPLTQYQDYSQRIGEENARWAINEEYRNYKRLVFINMPVEEDLACYRDYARETADFLGLSYEETEGSLELIKKLLYGKWDGSFAVIEPGKVVTREYFF